VANRPRSLAVSNRSASRLKFTADGDDKVSTAWFKVRARSFLLSPGLQPGTVGNCDPPAVFKWLLVIGDKLFENSSPSDNASVHRAKSPVLMESRRMFLSISLPSTMENGVQRCAQAWVVGRLTRAVMRNRTRSLAFKSLFLFAFSILSLNPVSYCRFKNINVYIF
jgi:hypothetical protein